MKPQNTTLTEGAMPVHKATIVPRGSALGMVTQLPDKDETGLNRRQLLARLDVCMGGEAPPGACVGGWWSPGCVRGRVMINKIK